MLNRLFQIVYLLMEKTQMTAGELAEILEVSERTIYRDIDKLTVAGIPTWFHGYTEKFFYDRGVLYVYLYGMMAKPFAMRFMLKHKNKLKNTPESISYKQAVNAIMKGIDDTK